MAVKEDLRVKKTKAALQDAFFALLREKTFEDLTVNELCETAGVRRATFYKHYSDKFSFLTSLTKDLRYRFNSLRWRGEAVASSPKYYSEYAKRIVEFIDEHEAVVQNIMRSNLLFAMMNIITEQNYKDTKELLLRSAAMGMKLSASAEVTASMLAGGVATTIYEWIAEGKKKSVDELSDEIGRFVVKALSST